MKHRLIALIVMTSILLGITSCSSKNRPPEADEFDELIYCLLGSSKCNELEVISRSVNYENFGRAYISFLGTSDLSVVDNVAYAYNEFMKEHPDCFIIEHETALTITFYNYKPGNLVNYDECFAKLGNYYSLAAGTEVIGNEIQWINIRTTFLMKFSTFAECKTQFNSIVFSQAVEMDDIHAIENMDQLQKIRFDLAEHFDHGFNMPNFDYELYSSYVDAFNQINSEKGYMFATFDYSDINFRVKAWKEEYGEDFVTLDEY